MKKLRMVFVAMAFTCTIPTNAQNTPLYECDTVDVNQPVAAYGQSPFDGKSGNCIQMIYYYTDFPGMPAQGQITDLYIKLHYKTPKGATLKKLMVKMGATSLTGFPMNSQGKPKVTAGVNTVFYDSLYVLPDTVQAGGWWRLVLPIPYNYSFVPGTDGNKNLLIEFSCIPILPSGLPNTHFNTLYYGYGSFRPTGYIEMDTSSTMYYSSPVNWLMIIGLNPKPNPVRVEEPQITQHLGMFPNPATNTLYLSTAGSYELYDMRGVQVLKGETADRQIDVKTLPAGFYIVQLRARSGVRIMGKFCKE